MARKRNTCRMDGCNKDVMSNGLCDKHRKRVSRNGITQSTRPTDWGQRTKHPLYTYWCDTKRRETLNIIDEWISDFWSFINCIGERPSKNHYLRAVDLTKKLGPDNWQWIEGITNAERHMANKKKQNAQDRKRAKVSVKEREELMKKANSVCEICGGNNERYDSVTGVKKNTLCVDHCHETGELRGILCSSCNAGLGQFKDNPDTIRKAIEYLELPRK